MLHTAAVSPVNDLDLDPGAEACDDDVVGLQIPVEVLVLLVQATKSLQVHKTHS